MMGSCAAAVAAWYIEDVSNGTLGGFAKRSCPDEHAAPSDLGKRQSLAVPLSVLDPILGVFNDTFGEPASTAAYASWPNPFMGLNTTTPSLRNAARLKLIDGSLAGQAIPLWSLIQPARALDFIFAWDDSQDARPQAWNNGTNLYNTYIASKAAGIPFPIVPSAPTFIKNNYTTRPVFFGCDANLTTTKDPSTPIVLYLAAAPYSSYINGSFFVPATSYHRLNDIFVNSFNQLTQGNGTLDVEWAQCLGCATVDRSVARVGMQRTKQCQSCMERYCWDGISVPDKVAGPPGGTYEATDHAWANDLEMLLQPGISWAEWNATHEY